MVLTSSKLREVADELEPLEEQEDEIREQLGVEKWLHQQPLVDEYALATDMAKAFNMNLSQVKKELEKYPDDCDCDGQDISKVVKDLRKYRRKVKGENKIKLTKGIENLINSYSSHLNDCIKSIYWLNKYEYPLRCMKYDEMDLKKIHSIKDYNSRSNLVESLCKYWEADLSIKDITYSTEYATLFKQMKEAKREFRKILKDIPHQSIRKNLSSQVDDFIKKSVCDSPGISSRQIHDRMPNKLYKICSPQIISKQIKKIGITSLNGSNYKLPDEIKKDLYSYTASFIDSDGYITMDKSFNPRVGLVATGDRGKAFMIQIQKELGIGKLHLDQKSPQGTRPVNRLNFYSQADCHELLTKCLPHFRMKGKNAELLLELIKMKQGFKKEEWYKGRCEEIFALMKWENHKDHVGYNFAQYGIDPTIVAKLHDNCKMNVMLESENILKELKMSTNAKRLVDEIMADGKERNINEILDEMWEKVENAPDFKRYRTGRTLIPTRGELIRYLTIVSDEYGSTGERLTRTNREPKKYFKEE